VELWFLNEMKLADSIRELRTLKSREWSLFQRDCNYTIWHKIIRGEINKCFGQFLKCKSIFLPPKLKCFFFFFWVKKKKILIMKDFRGINFTISFT